ncbi:PREDICTED: protein LTV1 homolog [Priapulus caudatus]|uniref:Protein LTV1 homolog n=1 Tax=Priapulus caudatus TaxID=37621 RepID=A0ABM1DWV5_PRICU|nr:PREDICTED: protein LTV1 homolog [Priapulus caudatus]
MPRKSKPFIDKKKAVTFTLVHRSQKDPLQADDTAGQHVLLQGAPREANVDEKKLEEQRKFGVFFEDNYNYLQHLRDADEVVSLEPVGQSTVGGQRLTKDSACATDKDGSGQPKLELPSSVFGSEVEHKVGLLNKAAPSSGPKVDWDPDIVAALDDDFDFDGLDNQLEDDFIVKANAPLQETDEVTAEKASGSDYLSSNDGDWDTDDDEEDGREKAFWGEETRSRFTDYSISSSVIRRNEGLTLLDDRFEKIFEEYDEEEIGALDQEELEGCIHPGSEVLNSVLDGYEKEQQANKCKEIASKPIHTAGEEELSSTEDEDEAEELVKMVQPEKEQWDCESILSTYSNLYNHPKVIKEPSKPKAIKLNARTGIPSDVLKKRGLTQRQLRDLENQPEKDVNEIEMAAPSSARRNDETPEERKQRKLAVKQERKERRQEKKLNKMAFKEEEKRQSKMNVASQINQNSIKLNEGL